MKKLGCITIAVIVLVGIVAFAWVATEPVPEGPVPEVSKAGEVICELDGVTFTKVNDGQAYVGLYYNEKGALIPCLISKDPAAVQFTSSLSDMTHGSIESSREKDTYYYSQADNVGMYTEERQSADDLPLVLLKDTTTAFGAQEELMELVSIQEAGGPLLYFVKYYLIWFIVIPLGIFICLRFFGQKDTDDYAPTGGSASSTKDIGAALRDIDEMNTMKRIRDNVNTPGYDADSFGPPSDL